MTDAAVWQDMLTALDGLNKNAKAVNDFLQTRRPEQGGHLVYTPLEPLIKARDEFMDLIRKTQDALKNAGNAPEGWQEAVKEKVKQFDQLESLNNAKLNELADYYKGRLQAAKQSRDTVSAYKQQYQTAMDMSIGGLLNETK